MIKRICLFLIIVISACKNPGKSKQEQVSLFDLPLFTIRNHEHTGIKFKNMLTESRNLNGIFYEYFYNGGGVAVADFNGDQLQDLYFVSNLKANMLYLNKGGLKFEGLEMPVYKGKKKGFPTGVTVVDINADGKQDIYVCKSGNYKDINRTRNELFVNIGNDEKGRPIFDEQAAKYGLDIPYLSTQAAFFDYDKDGDLDMFLINHATRPYDVAYLDQLLATPNMRQSSALFKNENGIYKDVSKNSGIINNSISFGLGIAIGDLNNDTWPDIIVGQDFSEKDHLYLNQQDGTFKEVMNQATNHISYFSMGNDISDVNNDGWLDFITVDMTSEHNYDIKTSMSGMNIELFNDLVNKGLHNQYMYNALQINNGMKDSKNLIPSFSDVAQMYGVSSTDWSWGPLVFDMDNDGWKDIFVANGVKRDFRNNDYNKYKDLKFAEFYRTHKVNTKQNKELAKDLVMELLDSMPERFRPNYFFKNEKGQGFTKQNVSQYPTCSNGAAYVDLDGDGDLDIVVNNSDDFALIYENNSTNINTNNYVSVKLKGSENNSNGIGTRVILENDDQIQILENYASRGFQSASISNLHFGVGNTEVIDKLIVKWPDGKQQTLKAVNTNQEIVLDYKDAEIEHVVEKPPTSNTLFTSMLPENIGLNWKHEENTFDDFTRESLLPHKMSQFGPAMAVGDINGDGTDDVYFGGAQNQEPKLFIQNEDGIFKEIQKDFWKKEKVYEDVDALFFDSDNDGDLDLYVVSGGNEKEVNANGYQDRLYENKQGKFVYNKTALPLFNISGSKVKTIDFDNDGDLDLFVGGRQYPGKYPLPVSSYLLRNDSNNGEIKFISVASSMLPELENIGMVTDVLVIDLDNDKLKDLIVVGEWMAIRAFRNTGEKFIEISEESGFKNNVGWWNTIKAADFDQDGDLDLVVGNLGLNYKYKASIDHPFKIYAEDFDKTGTIDIVLGYYEGENLYPLRGRQCSSEQMPFIKKKFKTYNEFGSASLVDVYGEDQLNASVNYGAQTFANTYFENKDGVFIPRILPNEAQTSSINDILIEDFNKDGYLDMVIAGNLYGAEVETPRNDASIGLYLKGNGKGEFKPVPMYESGLFVKGEVRHIKKLSTNTSNSMIFVKNNEEIEIVKWD